MPASSKHADNHTLKISPPRRGSVAGSRQVLLRRTCGAFAFMITKERLDELMSYDPETGHFIRRVTTGNRAKAGAIAGTAVGNGYRMIWIDGNSYSAHRLAFLAMVGSVPPADIDHVNGVRTDNRWANLRPATRSENMRNVDRRSDNTSGATGVVWKGPLRKWQAQLVVDRKHHHLGYFVEFEDAVAARRAAEIKYFGEFSATTSRKILDAPPTSC